MDGANSLGLGVVDVTTNGGHQTSVYYELDDTHTTDGVTNFGFAQGASDDTTYDNDPGQRTAAVSCSLCSQLHCFCMFNFHF